MSVPLSEKASDIAGYESFAKELMGCCYYFVESVGLSASKSNLRTPLARVGTRVYINRPKFLYLL